MAVYDIAKSIEPTFERRMQLAEFGPLRVYGVIVTPTLDVPEMLLVYLPEPAFDMLGGGVVRLGANDVIAILVAIEGHQPSAEPQGVFQIVGKLIFGAVIDIEELRNAKGRMLAHVDEGGDDIAVANAAAIVELDEFAEDTVGRDVMDWKPYQGNWRRQDTSRVRKSCRRRPRNSFKL